MVYAAPLALNVLQHSELPSMNAFDSKLSRRSFLSFLAVASFNPGRSSAEHHFAYEGVIGTSLDLVVWTASAPAARLANHMVLQEIDRLTSILDTRDPASEISLAGATFGRRTSRELADVLAAYDGWERRTGGVLSVRPGGAHAPLNVDALGKAYIIDCAARAVRTALTAVDALLLNIGGDITTWGRSCNVAIADPRASHDNGEPIARVVLANAAIATSGCYARGAHLWNAKLGRPAGTGSAATVVAADAVTANALATTLCVMGAGEGLRLVESTPGAEALFIAPNGALERTTGFAGLERAASPEPMARTGPAGFQLTVTLTLAHGRSSKRPYVAVWAEDTNGKLARLLAVWGNQSKYLPDLSSMWRLVGRDQNLLHSVTRATRSPGKYELVWDGLNDERKPVPPGTYHIVVETNQEHGTYAKQSGTIELGDRPTSITLPATTNFEPVLIQYRPQQGGS